MIKFAPFVEYEMDKCYLTSLECIALIMNQMCDWDDDDSCEVLDALMSQQHQRFFYDSDHNRTIFEFDCYKADFHFFDGRSSVELCIYYMSPEDGELVFSHVFDSDEEMDFVDFSNYHDPQRMDWDD